MRALSDGERTILAQDGPEEEALGYRILNYRFIKAAQKHHFCDNCPGGWIAPGESYRRLVMLEDGRVGVWRHCTREDVPCARADTTQHWRRLAGLSAG